ncbi:Protein CBG17584 [Caenorhabditis briggsae]|uniref:Protein CBG17584 n=1 Tax=Caenorhabditis briggsae TaxID=6238 RepID=A8XRA3_CAEBR|nr:Protein CBG17584 [Caenorhabditis briggsae]CAP35200.2 Protein CBG17584 [Caenorhabditis briggsae]
MWRNVVLRSDSRTLSEKRLISSCIRIPPDPVIDCVSWEQAWELLKKMACNPECLDNIVNSLSKFATQMENTPSSVDRDQFDAHMGGLLHKMIHTAIEEYESSTPTYKKQKKLHLTWLLSQIATFCFTFLQKGTSRQFSALNTLNKIIDAGLVHDLFAFNDVIFHSSRILNRSHAFDSDEPPTPSGESFNSNADQNSTVDHVFIYGANYKYYFQFSSLLHLIIISRDQSFLPSPTVAPTRHKSDLMNAFSDMDPGHVIAALHNALTMQQRDGSNPVCSPAHRWRQCCAHCTQILVARLLLFLTHAKKFRNRLSEYHQLQSFISLLETTLEPQLLCILLQVKLHNMLLPGDAFYYTNHSTKYGTFVKYHAARVLVYVGIGDQVNSRVNLFNLMTSEPSLKSGSQQNEDDYICETCTTPRSRSTFSRSAVSVEGVLLKVLAEVAELVRQSQHLSASEPITEESPSAGSPPAVLPNQSEQKNIIEKNTEKLTQLGCQILISLEQLEAHLCKLGLVLDSVLLLRLLLHKLSWDLGLVTKKRPVAATTVVDHVCKPINDPRAHSSCSLGNNRNFGKDKCFDRREDSKRDKNYLRVDQGSRASKRVHIRRSSSVEIIRPKRLSSGAKDIKNRERRKRLGTDTSSGSNRSKKTNSSSSSVQKHLPKYIQSLFRSRMGTDPCKRTSRSESTLPHRDSNESNTSGSDAVLEFTRKLQNYPLTRREAQRLTYRSNGQQDSNDSKIGPRTMGYVYLPELEIQGISWTIDWKLVRRRNNNVVGHTTSIKSEAIPGLPLIEIRRPSALSQFEFGYFVNSPELSGSEVSDCAPLLLSGQIGGSRKSSDETSLGGWSSRASSVMSQRSSRSSVGLRLSTFSGGTSIASDNSGPFLFSFVLRKRASTIGTRIPIPRRALSRSSGDSLRVPDRESPLHLASMTEMNPDFQCVRQLILNLLNVYNKRNKNVVSSMNECTDVLRAILNSPQHPTVKNWCAEIIHVVNTHVEEEEPTRAENNEQINDEYLEILFERQPRASYVFISLFLFFFWFYDSYIFSTVVFFLLFFLLISFPTSSISASTAPRTQMNRKSKVRISNRGISELVRRATIGALFPNGPVPRRTMHDLPSIRELMDESDIFETETETENESDSEIVLPTVKVTVPTDGTVRNLEEFISNYDEHSSDRMAPTKDLRAPRRSLHIGALIPDPKQLTAKLKRSKSLPKIQNMDQIKAAIRRKSSLRKWFATRTVAGRRNSNNTNNYECKRTSITHEDFLAQMRNVTRNTLKHLLFPDKKSEIRIVRMTNEKFHDVDELAKQIHALSIVSGVQDIKK